MLQGAAAKLQQQLAEGRLGKLSPDERRAGPEGLAGQASAAAHLGSSKAVQADRMSPRRRQLRGLASLSSIAKRSPRGGSATPSHMENPEPGHQPGQLHVNSSRGRPAAGWEAGRCVLDAGSLDEEPVQRAASAAAVAASPECPSPRVEAWTSEHMAAPRRLQPLNPSRQGTAGPTAQMSGDWVSCLRTACTGACPLAAKLDGWSGHVCRWVSQQHICNSLWGVPACHLIGAHMRPVQDITVA